MSANTFGKLFCLTTFGESHGPAMGAVIDGCPAGIPLTAEDIQKHLDRRRPGQSTITTSRSEPDHAQILSGVFEDKTLGSPICVVVQNTSQRSEDYDPNYFRTGHADRVWQDKFGHRDHRGGGRASGRETLSRVIGGAIALKTLPESINIVAFTRQIGHNIAQNIPADLTTDIVDQHPTRCPDPHIADLISADLLACKQQGDSRGGIIELWIDGCPAGLGEPVFQKAKNLLANAMMSVGAVVGVTIGDAFQDATRPGLDFHTAPNNTALQPGISPTANGIQGGITNGERIILRIAFKPASTVGSMAQQGRHDPCIVPRAIPVLEAMAALVLADLHLAARTNRL